MENLVNRQWGHYLILHENLPNVKLKELVVQPGKSLSMQRHTSRSEFWFISEGQADVYTLENNETKLLGIYKKHESLFINCNQWHQLQNNTDSLLKIIEIQYGINCVEEDIERK
jgi:mannose-1-phosphate guanylyltransferase/mannose-6-phosphate isomerase